MKDMYSFHADESDLDAFYDRVTRSYMRVYERCGLGPSTVLTYASGGVFSKYSHEFQTVTPYGEDVLYRVPGMDIAVNKEIVGDPTALSDVVPGYEVGSEARWEELKAIEVGNIFKLGTRFSDAFGVRYADHEGKVRPVVMGCYGLGPSRVMGTIAECLSDDRGLAWPDEVAPYRVHLASLVQRPTDIEWCTALYDDLQARGLDVLYDDREDIQPGEKLADADLIGLPHRFVVSRRTLAAGVIEWKKRTAADSIMLPREEAINLVASP